MQWYKLIETLTRIKIHRLLNSAPRVICSFFTFTFLQVIFVYNLIIIKMFRHIIQFDSQHNYEKEVYCFLYISGKRGSQQFSNFPQFIQLTKSWSKTYSQVICFHIDKFLNLPACCCCCFLHNLCNHKPKRQRNNLCGLEQSKDNKDWCQS